MQRYSTAVARPIPTVVVALSCGGGAPIMIARVAQATQRQREWNTARSGALGVDHPEQPEEQENQEHGAEPNAAAPIAVAAIPDAAREQRHEQQDDDDRRQTHRCVPP